jgi:hypothetical protein
MQMTHAAIQFGYFELNIGCLQFECEFQAERDQNLRRRKMNRNNSFAWRPPSMALATAHDGINYGLIPIFADQKTFGLPR